MRVIFQTAPFAAVDRIHNADVSGVAQFIVHVYLPGEPAVGRDRLDLARPVSFWRDRLPPNEPLRFGPPRFLRGSTEVAIPRALLDGLPGDATLVLGWRFTKAGHV